ncbi:MAG TPA: hypothetical protein VGN95_24700 [Pyrinomonadaceae bacterium]|jgi:hypothetical protein|nr:hypothetical protein [Pyrinomonadaceae bacterium]
MPLDISKWDSTDDPITREQVALLDDILEGQVSEVALEGFLIVCSRFVDEVGNHRTDELVKIFKTESQAGKEALHLSLEHVCRWVGGMKGYVTNYPVEIKPPNPAFPLFKIINIHKIADRLYRVLDSKSPVFPAKGLIKGYVMRTDRLPAVPIQLEPVRRSKPQFHWCSYEAWETPDATKDALQILPEWSNCKLRATLPTYALKYSAYVAFNGDRNDPKDSRLGFYKYFYEPLAQDHSSLPGGGPQIGVEGRPLVDVLEEWDDGIQGWERLWVRQHSRNPLWAVR